MKAAAKLVLAFLAPLLFTGCIAGIDAVQVTNEENETPGLRYFLPVPVLIIREYKGQVNAEIKMAVDRKLEYSVQPYTWLGTSESTIEFNDDGTLKSFTLNQDTSEIPDAAVQALKDIGVKELDLRQEEVQRKIDKSSKNPAGLSKEENPQNLREETSVHMYVIRGDRLEEYQKADLIFAAATSQNTGAPSGEKDLICKKRGGKIQISHKSDPLGTNLISNTKFLVNNEPAKNNETLRKEVKKSATGLEIDEAVLAKFKITQISIGTYNQIEIAKCGGG